MRAHERRSLRRAAVALSAASILMAAGAGTAHAADPTAQLNDVGASAEAVAASAQGASANLNAPVRVLSDGDDATAGARGGSPSWATPRTQ